MPTHPRPRGIRITLTGLPSMLQDIVRDAVERERDIRIVGEYTGGQDLLRDLAARATDVAIVGVEQTERPEEVAFIHACLRAAPSLRLLLIARGGRSALLYELRPQKIPLGEVSRDGLIAAIRGQAWAADGRQEGN